MIRFPLHHLCPRCGDPMLAPSFPLSPAFSALPGFLLTPLPPSRPDCSATAGSTRGRSDSSLAEPHFPHWGQVAQTSCSLARGGSSPEAPPPPQSFPGVQRALESDSLMLASTSPSSWLHLPGDFMSSKLILKGLQTHTPPGSQ